MTQVPIYIHNAIGKPGLLAGFTHPNATPAEVAGRVFTKRRASGLWATAVRWKDGWLASTFKPTDEQAKDWENRTKSVLEKSTQVDIAH